MISAVTIIPSTDKTLRIALLLAHNAQCFYTGRDISLDDMHVDHIQARRNGGLDQILNYVPSCAAVNLSKNDRHDGNFISIVREVNRLIYADKVVEAYNQRIFSDNGLITLYDYFRKTESINKLSDKEKINLRQRIRASSLQFIRKPDFRWLFYIKKDLDEFIAKEAARNVVLECGGRVSPVAIQASADEARMYKSGRKP